QRRDSSHPQLESNHWNSVGLVAVVVGAIGLGVGAVLTAMAFEQAADADCDSRDRCSPRGLRQRSDAQGALSMGYAVASGGVILGVGGGVLYVYTSDQASTSATSDSGSSVGLKLRG